MPGGSTRSVRTFTAAQVVARLCGMGDPGARTGLARYAIPSDRAFGVSVGRLHALAKELGRDHALALALWKTGWYEARLLACFVDDPALVTPAQMDRWCTDFDNWAICDTACFHLFDRTPHAFAQITAWARRQPEFEKRAAFALLASLALHDKACEDAPFERALRLAVRAASDERNFVKKAVVWALRHIALRSHALHDTVSRHASDLAGSANKTEAWVGRSVQRGISTPAARKRLASRARARGDPRPLAQRTRSSPREARRGKIPRERAPAGHVGNAPSLRGASRPPTGKPRPGRVRPGPAMVVPAARP